MTSIVKFIDKADKPFQVALNRQHHQVFDGMDLDDDAQVLPQIREELKEHLKGFVQIRRKIESIGEDESSEEVSLK